MNIEQLRNVLSEQILDLRAGKRDVARANAMCNTAGKVIGCVRLELEYAKMMGVKPEMRFISDRKAELPKLPKEAKPKKLPKK